MLLSNTIVVSLIRCFILYMYVAIHIFIFAAIIGNLFLVHSKHNGAAEFKCKAERGETQDSSGGGKEESSSGSWTYFPQVIIGPTSIYLNLTLQSSFERENKGNRAALADLGDELQVFVNGIGGGNFCGENIQKWPRSEKWWLFCGRNIQKGHWSEKWWLFKQGTNRELEVVGSTSGNLLKKWEAWFWTRNSF